MLKKGIMFCIVLKFNIKLTLSLLNKLKIKIKSKTYKFLIYRRLIIQNVTAIWNKN